MHTPNDAVPTAEVMAVAREFVIEAYEGPSPQGSWFTSPGADAGLFGTIADLTAERASRPSRPGGPSIAAHVEHLRWTLELVNATIRGAPWQPDWGASWSLSAVDEPAWQALRSQLQREFAELRQALDGSPDASDPMVLRGILALAPHAAYHLGAIRLLALQVAS